MSKLSPGEVESLSKLRKVVGNGSKLLGIADHSGLTGYAFIAQEDTTITVFSVDGVDSLSDYGLSGATVKAGAYIVVPEGSAITAITLTAGSVIIYNL